MEEELLLKKIEELALLLLTRQQVADILELDSWHAEQLANPYTPVGRVYRRALARKARDLHEKTLRLADVGAPSALQEAIGWLKTAILSADI